MRPATRLATLCAVVAGCGSASIATAQRVAYPQPAVAELTGGPTLSGDIAVVKARVTNATGLRALVLADDREIATATATIVAGRRVPAELSLRPDAASLRTLAATGVLRVASCSSRSRRGRR